MPVAAASRAKSSPPTDQTSRHHSDDDHPTNIGIESAEIVITGDRLGTVMDDHQIGVSSYRKTNQNLVLAFSFNGIGVLAAYTTARRSSSASTTSAPVTTTTRPVVIPSR